MLVLSGPTLTSLPVQVPILPKLHGREQVGLDLARDTPPLPRRAVPLTSGKQDTAALARQFTLSDSTLRVPLSWILW